MRDVLLDATSAEREALRADVTALLEATSEERAAMETTADERATMGTAR